MLCSTLFLNMVLELMVLKVDLLYENPVELDMLCD
jgi:hypothetical protein